HALSTLSLHDALPIFTAVEDPTSGRRLFGAKLIPNRGAWLEIETSAKDLVTVKIDRKRKVPVTVLLKALELPSLKGTDGDREARSEEHTSELQSPCNL